MNLVRAPLLCLALAAPAWAQDPGPAPMPVAPVYANAVITAPATLPAGVPLVVFGDESSTARPLQWSLISPKGPFEVWDAPDDPRTGRKGIRSGLFVVRKPAPGVTYKLAAVATGDDGASSFDFAEVRVNAPKPKPDPPPVPPAPGPKPDPPGPGPSPAPAPIPAGWHATLVRPPGPPALLLELSPLFESQTAPAAVAAMGGNWHVLDAGSAEFARRQLGPVLAKGDPPGTPVSPPCLVIQDASGAVLKLASIAPGGDEEPAVLAYIRSAVGAK